MRWGLVLVGAGLIFVAIPAIWVYMSATATLHSTPQEAPSVALAAPAEKWAYAVEQGRQVVRASLVEQNLPGLSVAVGMRGEVVWAEGFGFADLEKRTPVTPQHRFRIGTASTVLTSAAAGLLLEDGRLRLDEAIQTYVPEFRERVTLRQLMGHVAGVRNDGGDEGPLLGAHCERAEEALPHFAGRSLLFKPGTGYRYSSYGWIVVSAAIEAAAGQPFLAFMQAQVFDRLGMRDTVADSAEARATSYFPRFAAKPIYGLHPMRAVDYSCYAGSSVFVSTPSDLVRFGMGIEKLLKRATVRLLQTSLRVASGEETGYGLGWDLETVTLGGESTRVVGHDGEVLGGVVASLVVFPEMVVAVTSNISYADTFSVAVKVAEGFARK